MASNPMETAPAVEREEDGMRKVVLVIDLEAPPVEAASHPKEEEDRIYEFEDAHKQLMVYDPSMNDAHDVDPIRFRPVHVPGTGLPNQQLARALPSVGAFTVQCAVCFKWRFIPTKEKYEVIRAFLLEHPFVCEDAREWRPTVSCGDPTDITPDGSRLWAIDKPSIALPPPGWQRLLRLRGSGGSKFADVYYVAPSGRRMRSMVEVQRFLVENPEYVNAGVNLSQFSFQIPRPLQANYVRRRRPARLPPTPASTIALLGPEEEDTDLRLGRVPEQGESSKRAKITPSEHNGNEHGRIPEQGESSKSAKITPSEHNNANEHGRMPEQGESSKSAKITPAEHNNGNEHGDQQQAVESHP